MANKRLTSAGMAAKSVALTATERQQLCDLYDALTGVVCEQGEETFDDFHKRGGSAMLSELETILKRVAPVEFAKTTEGYGELPDGI